MLARFSILLLLALSPHAALGAIESGSYLFLHSKIVGCGEKTFLVGYAEVPEDGNVMFLDEYEINVVGQSAETVALQLARMIGADIGSAPKTISIRVLPNSEGKDVAKELEGVVLPFPECRGLRRPTSPGPDLEQIRGLANASHDLTDRCWPEPETCSSFARITASD
ncbi:MAG: hypothetical protein P8Z33_12545, partial [Gammaproteobacteria bacterium]